MKRIWMLSTTLLLTAVAQQATLQSVRAAAGDSRSSRYVPAYAPASQPAPLDPRNVPDFAGRADVPVSGAQPGSGSTGGAGESGTPLQSDASSTTIPVETRLKLVLESAVDAKSSQPGNIFEAHVKDDLFLGNSLLLAKGSLVRGRVCEVTKPRLLSRAGKIGLKLEQITTPVGEVIPLDAGLEFHKGVTNAKGQLDPGTSLGSRVHDDVRSATGMNSKGTTRNILVGANVATLGAPAVAAALGGGAIALFRSGDNVNLVPGQELEVLLTNDLGLQLN